MKDYIIISGFYSSGSGLTNLMYNLTNYLSSSFNIVCIGCDPDKKNTEPVKTGILGHDAYILPVNGTGNFFRMDSELLQFCMEKYKPVGIIMTCPVLFNRYLLLLLQKYRAQTQIISYISVEGQLVDINFLKYATLIDHCVFYTKSVYNDFKKLLQENSIPDSDFGPVKYTHIGHGTDKQTYYPIPAGNDRERRKSAREIMYPGTAVNENSFIVLNMNRPYYRKRMDITIEGFRQFAVGKENVFLHLHLGRNEHSEMQKCYGMIEKAGLEGKAFITPEAVDYVKPVDWLNTMYNACDVGITTSMGEGWGLGLFEHAATKAAMVAPAHTSFLENWGGAALMMPTSGIQHIFQEQCDMHTVSPEEVCKSLNMLYADKGLLDKVALDCYNRIHEPKYDWAAIAGKFKQIILGM